MTDFVDTLRAFRLIKFLNLDLNRNKMEVNNHEKESVIPDSHYNLIAEEREKYLSGEIQGSSWEEIEQRLNSK